MRRTVLVTDGEQRASLAIVRSLGQAGHSVHVCSVRAKSLAGASRYCQSQSLVPDPLSDPPGFVSAIRAIIARVGADVMIPISEPALLALLPERDRLHGVVMPFPDYRAFRDICDKELVLDRAASLGLAVPAQAVLQHPDDSSAAQLLYPLALKPCRSVGERDGRRVRVGVGYASSPAALRGALAAFDEAAFPVLAQQRIVGPGVGVFLLIWNGEILAMFGHRRIREKPPSGGISVYRESIDVDASLVERSRRLLASFNWQGVAMVEYKLDGATGTPYLMEINGRFWGSLQLALDAGVDFPRLLVDAATGARVRRNTGYRSGVRSRWWWGDVDQLLLRLRRSADELNLPPGAPGRLQALAEFLKVWRPGDRNEVLRLGDPMPFLRETVDWLRGL